MSLRRRVTTANLFENLFEVYGEREALCMPEPMGYRLFPSAALTTGDCLRFTNLAAEAFIRELDLRKGQRVLLYTSGRGEDLLLALAAMKAGGIVVPLPPGMEASEVEEYAGICGAKLAISDPGRAGSKADIPRGLPGVERFILAGPRRDVPSGFRSLDAAMDRSSGFFIPYTLKPGSVVALFCDRAADGSPLAVMASSRNLTAVQRRIACLLPAGPGSTALCALSPSYPSGFSTLLAGLFAGLRTHLVAGDLEAALRALRGGVDVFLGSDEICGSLLDRAETEGGIEVARLWFSAERGRALEREKARLKLACGVRKAPGRPLLLQTWGVTETTGLAALRLYPPGPGRRVGRVGLQVPLLRFKKAGGTAKAGGSEFLVKGPTVTFGYWNDLDRTFDTVRDGWLYTGPWTRGKASASVT